MFLKIDLIFKKIILELTLIVWRDYQSPLYFSTEQSKTVGSVLVLCETISLSRSHCVSFLKILFSLGLIVFNFYSVVLLSCVLCFI